MRPAGPVDTALVASRCSIVTLNSRVHGHCRRRRRHNTDWLVEEWDPRRGWTDGRTMGQNLERFRLHVGSFFFPGFSMREDDYGHH